MRTQSAHDQCNCRKLPEASTGVITFYTNMKRWKWKGNSYFFQELYTKSASNWSENQYTITEQSTTLIEHTPQAVTS